MIELFRAGAWQMTAGERAALESVVRNISPDLAIEIGTAEGGSLACIAAHAKEVHSFDLVPPAPGLEQLPNVFVYTGDSHKLLRARLQQLELEERNIDFALVDGDHTTEGVQRDVEDLLGSGAVSMTVILIHDTANQDVRAGLEAVDYAAWPKVKAVDLDFVPGYLVKAAAFRNEIWGGLGLIVVDASDPGTLGMHLVSDIAYPMSQILADRRTQLLSEDGHAPTAMSKPDEAQELSKLVARVGDLEQRLDVVTSSRSWRMTAPLRHFAARIRH
jgi:hypothetical protein